MIAAIVPGAGLSRRMGRPKLILPLADGRTVLSTVLSGLIRGGVECVILVTPPRDSPLAELMGREAVAINEFSRFREGEPPGEPLNPQARREPHPPDISRTVKVLVPEVQPEDMRASVELGLAALPVDDPPTTLLLCPADSPGITAGLVARVLELALKEPEAIVIPTFQGKRGHPVAMPWSIAQEIPKLPEGVGVNALIKQHSGIIVEIVEEEPGAILDLDTPEDYRRWEPATKPNAGGLPDGHDRPV